MAFGLTGAPSTFQKDMNTTLAPLLRKCALVFFDDILVYNSSFQDHIQHLQQVLQLLQTDDWKIKLSKCSFTHPEISYLGHIISSQGVATNPGKVATVASWHVPVSVKDLRSFLGLAGYYSKFVRHFGIISRPLTDLLRKHTCFVWTVEHTTAFEALKQGLISAPILSLPNFSKVFIVETDASDEGIGAVLMQEGHPLTFLSKSSSTKSKGMSTYEKEYLAILLAVEHWHPCLQ
jgi:hypothetical protein